MARAAILIILNIVGLIAVAAVLIPTRQPIGEDTSMARGFTISCIPLDKDNRMLRFGVGKHDGYWFIRADCWCSGWRISRKTQ